MTTAPGTSHAGLPLVQAALVATAPGVLALKSVPLPAISTDEVLVKTAAVALNPSDHKLLDQSTTLRAISGSDYSGTVVKVGDEAGRSIRVGDRVCGVVFGGNPGNPGNGAFSQFVAVPADLCLRVPEHFDIVEAAALGMAVMTTGLALRSLGIPFRRDDSAQPADHGRPGPWVLVNGGATATGTMALQFLRLAGYRTVATCSPHNFELVKGRGALHVMDYGLPGCRDDIRALTGNGLRYALDCIGDAATMTLCHGALGDDGGRYTALEAYPRKLTIRRRDVRHDWILGWTLFGEEVQLAGVYHRPASPQDRKFGAEWVEVANGLLEQNKLKVHPLERHMGGLAAILPRLNQARAGKLRGKKLVFPL